MFFDKIFKLLYLNELKLYFKHLEECSHQFAPEIFAWSINNKTMKGCTGCFSYDQYHSGKCRCEDKPILGEYVTEELYNGYVID